MNAVIQMMPASANSAATSPMRRMFSCRSSGENPRSELSPRRTSPSSVGLPAEIEQLALDRHG
jgi:hypothetical protein